MSAYLRVDEDFFLVISLPPSERAATTDSVQPEKDEQQHKRLCGGLNTP
jgi:hypothetical protein